MPDFVVSPDSPTVGWRRRTTRRRPSSVSARLKLGDHLQAQGREPDGFPNALATMWCYITEDASEADAVFRDRVAPVIHRPEDVLRERLPIGSAGAFADKLARFVEAGVQRVFIWPVADERRQLELFAERVLPQFG